jgi:hypothetical protein
MTTDHRQRDDANAGAPRSAVDRFLQAVETKTNNPVHTRLLQVCRQANPADALEAELRAIVSEIVDEA